jgi:hypothetical protein
LAAILFVLLVGRTAAVELLGSLFWVAVVIFAVAAVGLLVRETFRSFHARAQEKLDDEIKLLCEEISTYPGPQLTAEHIPQRFPSKEAAQAFGERWSRGGPDSFSARAVDVNNRSDDLPGFDKTSISGGILFTTPALFFGKSEAHRDNDVWWLDFLRAKKRWLTDYRDHLKKGLAPSHFQPIIRANIQAEEIPPRQ